MRRRRSRKSPSLSRSVYWRLVGWTMRSRSRSGVFRAASGLHTFSSADRPDALGPALARRSAVASLRDEVAAHQPAAAAWRHSSPGMSIEGGVSTELTGGSNCAERVAHARRPGAEVATSRSAYERWLEQVLEHFTSALETEGLDVGDLVRARRSTRACGSR